MKIIWIISDVLEPFFPYVKGKPTTGGSWIAPLVNGLVKLPSIELGIITSVLDGSYLEKKIGLITYYSIPRGKRSNIKRLNPQMIKYYTKAIESFKPDIIHVHGTEKNYGLLREHIDSNIPIVCSIQGILSSCIKYLNYSGTDWNYKRYESIKNRLGRGGIKSLLRKWKHYTLIEEDIFKENKYFIGRTNWDKSQTLALNNKAIYYHGEELLRDPFYNNNWNIDDCNRYSIFISSGSYSLKGLHILLKAVAILKEKYPTIKVNIPLISIKPRLTVKDYLFGEDYALYISSLIKELNLENHINSFNRLNASGMVKLFKQSHIFVSSSYIENSSNAIGEATMIGTPTVTSYTGGIGTMLKDGESTLFFPIGDFSMLAYQIDQIFSNDELAKKMSVNAKMVAKKRHDINKTANQYYSIYKSIIEREKGIS